MERGPNAAPKRAKPGNPGRRAAPGTPKREAGGRYVHLRELGELGDCGLSVARRAQAPQAEPVLLEQLNPDASADPVRSAAFVASAKVVSTLAHPNISPLCDLGSDGGRYFRCYERPPGDDLSDVLARSSGLDARAPVPVAVCLALDLARGAAHAHGKDCLHGALSPYNVRILMDGRARVWGFESLTGPRHTGRPLSERDRYAYLAPERAAGLEVTPRADQFSIGAILYELLTGDSPFDRANHLATLNAVLAARCRPVEELRKEVPPALRELLRRVLQQRPQARFASMVEMAKALEGALQISVPEARARVASFVRARLSDGPPRSLTPPPPAHSPPPLPTAPQRPSQQLPSSDSTVVSFHGVASQLALGPAPSAPASVSQPGFASLLQQMKESEAREESTMLEQPGPLRPSSLLKPPAPQASHGESTVLEHPGRVRPSGLRKTPPPPPLASEGESTVLAHPGRSAPVSRGESTVLELPNRPPADAARVATPPMRRAAPVSRFEERAPPPPRASSTTSVLRLALWTLTVAGALLGGIALGLWRGQRPTVEELPPVPIAAAPGAPPEFAPVLPQKLRGFKPLALKGEWPTKSFKPAKPQKAAKLAAAKRSTRAISERPQRKTRRERVDPELARALAADPTEAEAPASSPESAPTPVAVAAPPPREEPAPPPEPKASEGGDEALLQVWRENKREVLGCLKEHPDGLPSEGRMRLSLELSASGEVRKASAQGDVSGSVAARCLEDRLRALRFPAQGSAQPFTLSFGYRLPH